MKTNKAIKAKEAAPKKVSATIKKDTEKRRCLSIRNVQPKIWAAFKNKAALDKYPTAGEALNVVLSEYINKGVNSAKSPKATGKSRK